MKSETAIRRQLAKLERRMTEQLDEIMTPGSGGFGSAASLFWDGRCVERRVLHEILGIKWTPFCAADVMAGW